MDKIPFKELADKILGGDISDLEQPLEEALDFSLYPENYRDSLQFRMMEIYLAGISRFDTYFPSSIFLRQYGTLNFELANPTTMYDPLMIIQVKKWLIGMVRFKVMELDAIMIEGELTLRDDAGKTDIELLDESDKHVLFSYLEVDAIQTLQDARSRNSLASLQDILQSLGIKVS